MELLQLKYFCDAAVTENFSQTAKKYKVPPSNISQSVKRLEKELSVTLFVRSANRVILSERGKAFYEEVKSALDVIDHAKNQITGKEEKGTVKIGVLVNRRIAMLAIEKYQRQFPKTNVIVRHDYHQDKEDFDFIIADRSLDEWDYYKEKILSEDIVLALKKGMLDTDHPHLVEEIEEMPFITMGKDTSHYRILQDISKKSGFEPRIALQSEDPFYIRKCVELGLGIVFTPEASWRGQFSEGVEFVKIGNYTRDTYLYRHNKNFMPQYVKDFYDIIKAEFENEK